MHSNSMSLTNPTLLTIFGVVAHLGASVSGILVPCFWYSCFLLWPFRFCTTIFVSATISFSFMRSTGFDCWSHDCSEPLVLWESSLDRTKHLAAPPLSYDS
ncbi:hypothetical protein F4604DRAFT_426779 [Suillus subluteus]|nr:hypothetical protein F4604DRAFT_426779 [Suillus subluteus]